MRVRRPPPSIRNVGPTDGAYKNWISQGFVADKAVVLADLTVGGERKGPHAFLIDLRKDGQLRPGVATGDMGIKTVGNDLDNAWSACGVRAWWIARGGGGSDGALHGLLLPWRGMHPA